MGYQSLTGRPALFLEMLSISLLAWVHYKSAYFEMYKTIELSDYLRFENTSIKCKWLAFL